eukprot:c23990_g12_i1 orf=152-394(+)
MMISIAYKSLSLRQIMLLQYLVWLAENASRRSRGFKQNVGSKKGVYMKVGVEVEHRHFVYLALNYSFLVGKETLSLTFSF